MMFPLCATFPYPHEMAVPQGLAPAAQMLELSLVIGL
jgi:hypothetical protein